MNSIEIHNFEMAIREAERFVRRMGEVQTGLESATNVETFDRHRADIDRMTEEASERFKYYEQLADLWRGADFNLRMFAGRRSHQDNHRRELASQLPTTLPELIARVDNEAQKQALQRLLNRFESNQMYLAEYEANQVTTGRGSEVEGTFTVFGTMRHGTRESYKVKWFRPEASHHSFWCSCPDHKFNSAKKNMVCKHICFLVARVGRILDPVFFDSKRLSNAQHAAFKRVVENAAIFADGARERERLAATPPVLPTRHLYAAHVSTTAAAAPSADEITARRAPFMELRKPVGAEDCCPICYDDMGSGSSTQACLSCPTCSNNVHRECMEVWLERHHTCVFCRSDVWRHW